MCECYLLASLSHWYLQNFKLYLYFSVMFLDNIFWRFTSKNSRTTFNQFGWFVPSCSTDTDIILSFESIFLRHCLTVQRRTCFLQLFKGASHANIILSTCSHRVEKSGCETHTLKFLENIFHISHANGLLCTHFHKADMGDPLL